MMQVTSQGEFLGGNAALLFNINSFLTVNEFTLESLFQSQLILG